ncbi:MAG: hypothetical protein NZ953_04340 [Thaumarchaeota archaeon]|nr:hypothetical protein [Candidatus Calditenuaceae archaeon]MCX8203783.1 hypothetical protein [Nitrososphaeria archaeon]MDW8043848.1 hypothetical protein [Nitrososphaerota archaeon]
MDYRHTVSAALALVILASLQVAFAQEFRPNCVLSPVPEGDQVRFVREGSTEEWCSGELVGPEYSGETETVLIRLSGLERQVGYLVKIEVEVSHARYLAARYFVGYGPASGGIFNSVDDVIRPGERKTARFEYYVSFGESGDLLVMASSISFRDTPAVLNYSVRASAVTVLDAPVITVKDSRGQVKSTVTTNWGDAPNDPYQVTDATAGLLPQLKVGEVIELSGFLSQRYAQQGARPAFFFSRDTTDVYTLRVERVPNSRLNVTVVPLDPTARLTVVIRTRDGFPINSTTGKPGEPVNVGMMITELMRDDTVILEVSLRELKGFSTGYRMSARLVEPPPKPQLPQHMTLPMPESQVRSLVLGISVAIISAVVVSAFVGRRKRTRMYYAGW